MRKPAGWTLLAISCVAWFALPVVPFVDAPAEVLAAWGAGIFVLAEVTWWGGLVLLGPEVIALGKRLWAWLKGRRGSARVGGDDTDG